MICSMRRSRFYYKCYKWHVFFMFHCRSPGSLPGMSCDPGASLQESGGEVESNRPAVSLKLKLLALLLKFGILHVISGMIRITSAPLGWSFLASASSATANYWISFPTPRTSM